MSWAPHLPLRGDAATAVIVERTGTSPISFLEQNGAWKIAVVD